MSANNFKIVAIYPASGSDTAITKNLVLDTIYFLDNNYTVDPSSSSNIILKENINRQPSTFYSDKNTSIEISAIVGSNGSGKTSLMEYLLSFMAVIQVKTGEKIETNPIIGKIFYQLNNELKTIELTVHDVLLNGIKEEHLLFEEELYWFAHYINFSPFSMLDNSLASTFSHANNKYEINILTTPKRKENNIVLNNEILVSQLNSLYFLKYYNPLMIDTIVYNLKDDVKILPLIFPSNFQNEITPYKFDPDSDPDLHISNYISIISHIFSFYEFKLQPDEVHKYILDYQNKGENFLKGYSLVYLVNKIIKLSNVYEESIYKNSTDDSVFKHIYYSFLNGDSSHLTFKIRQIINMFKFDYFSLLQCNADSIQIPLSDFNTFIDNVTANSHLQTEFIVPIGGFQPKLFKNGRDINKSSSGELQLFTLTANILTNIIRTNSRTYEYFIRDGVTDDASGTFFYNNLIILDELELNLHPRLQKSLIKTLVSAIDSIPFLTLYGIHLILLTHSPFILSDITSQNVLKLKEGKPQSNDNYNSFAANIHDLLNDEFFLDDGFIGAFAKDKIEKILIKPVINSDDERVIELIGDPFLKGLVQNQIADKLSNERLQQQIDRLINIQKSRTDNA